MKTLKTDCYLTILPRYRGDKVIGAKVRKVTSQYPRVPEGAPVIHLSLEIPVSALEAYEARLIVPAREISIIPVTIAEESNTLID